MNSSIAGPTWFGNQPVPMSSLSLQTMKNSPTMMLPTPGQPKGPTSSSRSMKVGIGGMMPRRSMMPGGGLGVNNSVAMAPLPAPIMGGGGGGHRGGGGGGGQSFSFAPTNYSNGDRYNAQGYRADGRRQILGGQSRNSSGLDDYYAMNALPDASPEERNAAVDAMNAGGQTAGFGGYGTAPEGTMPRRFAKGGYLPAGEPGIVADAGTELAVPHDGTRPELLPAVPDAPGGYEFTPSKDVTILPAPVVKRLPQLTAVPMPTAPSPVWLGPADLTPRSTGIASPEMRPRRGWASGALPSPPMASGEIAPFQGPQPMNFAATPSAPMPVPTRQDFAQALMSAPSPDGRPAGVKPTDWRRFLKSPQGMGFALDQQQSQQRFGQMMALEDQRYQRGRQDKQADREAEDQADAARWDSVADAMTAGGQLLTAADIAVIKGTKGAKAKQTVLDTLSKLRVQEMEDKRRAEQEAASQGPGVERPIRGTNYLGVYSPKGHLIQALPVLPKDDKPVPSPADIKKKFGDDWEPAGLDEFGNPKGYQRKQPAKPAKFTVWDEVTGQRYEMDGKPEDYDLTGYTTGPARKAAAATPSAPASKPSANNRYFPNTKPAK